MKRDELLKELDRIIDVGIVNAHHDKDVLKEVREQLSRPVYVVTSGCYSNYTLECVSFDKALAERYSKFCYDSNGVDEYIPIEMQTEDFVDECHIFVRIEWDPKKNEIKKIETCNWDRGCNYWAGTFCFTVSASSRVGRDVLDHGPESELTKKAAQDKFAEYKDAHPEEFPLMSGKLVFANGAVYQVEDEEKEGDKK